MWDVPIVVNGKEFVPREVADTVTKTRKMGLIRRIDR